MQHTPYDTDLEGEKGLLRELGDKLGNGLEVLLQAGSCSASVKKRLQLCRDGRLCDTDTITLTAHKP